MNRAIEQTSVTFTPVALYVTAGATYLALTLPCARLGRWLERRAVRERVVAPRLGAVAHVRDHSTAGRKQAPGACPRPLLVSGIHAPEVGASLVGSTVPA